MAERQESPLALTRRARRINKELAELYPNAHCELNFSNPLELSVATILSAQCTDKKVNEVTPALFASYPDAAAYAGAVREELEELIHPTGFFRAKTNNLIKLGQQLVERYDGAGAGQPGGAGDAAGLRPQDRQRGARQRLRRSRDHRRHPLPAAVAALGLDRQHRPGQGRGRGGGADPAPGLDDPVAPGDLARPPDVPRPPAGVRGLPAAPGCARRPASASRTRCSAAKLVKSPSQVDPELTG